MIQYLFLFITLISSTAIFADFVNLNTSFNTVGYVTTENAFQATAIAVQSTGQTIVAGTANINGQNNGFLTRYNQDGTIDSSFGGVGLGYVTLSLGQSSVVNGMALQSNDNIIIVGNLTDHNWGFIARYLPNGTLDLSFGESGNGYAIINLTPTSPISGHGYYTYTNAIAMQADGKIVTTGYMDDISALTFIGYAYVNRYSFDGILDTASFGSPNGYVTTTIPNNLVQSFGVAINSLGNIIITGSSSYLYNSNAQYIMIASYLPNGTLDSTFGTYIPGISLTQATNQSYCGARGIAIQPDNKPVVTGYAGKNSAGPFQVCTVRYTQTGDLDIPFGNNSNGSVLTAIGANAQANAIVVGPNDGIIVTGVTNPDGVTGNNEIFVMGYLSEGTLDQSFNLTGYILTNIASNYGANALVMPSQTLLLVAGNNAYAPQSIIILDYLINAASLENNANTNAYGMNPNTLRSSFYIQYFAKKTIANLIARAATIALVENIVSNYITAYAHQPNFNFLTSSNYLLTGKLNDAQTALTSSFPTSQTDIDLFFLHLLQRIALLAGN